MKFNSVIFILILITFSLPVLGEIDISDLDVNAFIEYGIGGRISDNVYKNKDIIFNEARARLEFAHYLDIVSFSFKTDYTADEYTSSDDIEIREANITLFPYESWEIKAGRQILTWGTGDMVFANDLFPKDWKSFFIGRDEEYLKSPVTAVKFSLFTSFANLDIAVVPKFTPDEYITGERMSYWEMAGLTGNTFSDSRPETKLKNAELNIRISKNIKGTEFALYGYKGFFKRPLSFDAVSNKGYFSKLRVYGCSVRTSILGGIANIETAYYDSIEDENGDKAFIENSYLKTIAGFEREILKDLTASVQLFTEEMQDFDKYKLSYWAMGRFPLKKEIHDWITLRITKLLKRQTLILSLFTYYSSAEKDSYIRPKITYKITDQIHLTAGGNIFNGKNDYTFFGQMQDNSNVYFRIRYSY